MAKIQSAGWSTVDVVLVPVLKKNKNGSTQKENKATSKNDRIYDIYSNKIRDICKGQILVDLPNFYRLLVTGTWRSYPVRYLKKTFFSFAFWIRKDRATRPVVKMFLQKKFKYTNTFSITVIFPQPYRAHDLWKLLPVPVYIRYL